MQEHDARLLRARLADFFDRRTPWQRALWHISTPLGLVEVVEYGEYVRSGAHPDRAGLKYVCEGLISRVELDAGLDPAVRAEVLAHLRGKPEETHTAHAITELSQRVSSGYIERWAESLQSPDPPGNELAARCVAAHLLDVGYSGDFLFRWLNDLTAETVDETIALLSAAEALVHQPEREFSILVPCPAMPSGSGFGPASLAGEAASAWHAANCPGAPAVPASRALTLQVTARDPFAAVEKAATTMARLAARNAVATDRRLTAHDKVWVAGESVAFDLNSGRRTIRVPLLQGHVLELGDSKSQEALQFDDALDLISSMAHGSDGAALTNGWAAIEGLLIEPGDRTRHLAADRMASIIACSFARAELTYLAWSHREHGDDELAVRLKEVRQSSNQQLQLVDEAMANGKAIVCGTASDEAALARVLQLRAAPREVLRRVERYVAEALRRLYTQRNQVMHAGSFRSATIAATLRTTPPLVGAGIDRIAAAQFLVGTSVSPLALSARAEVELRLVGTTGSAPLGRLLG